MLKVVDMLYGRALRSLLFRLDPEAAQKFTLSILTLLEHLPFSFEPEPSDAMLSLSRWGIEFSNPIGLGAGVDKNGRAALFWQKLGFGFAELGTVTPRCQVGNPKPRVWRLPERRGMVNSLGFPSKGSDWLAKRIDFYRERGVRIKLGLNIGPNKSTSPDSIIRDYTSLFAKLGPVADFVVVNVSSPNTPGLRAWQRPERIVSIVNELNSTPITSKRRPPVLVKLSPDIPSTLLVEISAAALDARVDGIVATNTTLERQSIGIDCPFPGGISGQPLKQLAREMIRSVYKATKGKIPIIGIGGIASAEDAYAHIRAGATFVEFCTGLVYEGPLLPKQIKAGLANLLTRDGFNSIEDAVGTENEAVPTEQIRRLAV
jgi:dihydroorotate dehydrogenase